MRRGELVDAEEVVKFAHLFEDDITIDNLSRSQLVAAARLLGINPFGPDSFLKFAIDYKINNLKS